MKASNFTSGTYLNASQLPMKPVDVTIERIAVESVGRGGHSEDKLIAYFRGKDAGLALNKTNIKALTAICGTDETDNWIGKTVTLIKELVTFQGNTVYGIRVVKQGTAVQGNLNDDSPPF